jgi:hypothetical protein
MDPGLQVVFGAVQITQEGHTLPVRRTKKMTYFPAMTN